jgi:hypothetical protein
MREGCAREVSSTQDDAITEISLTKGTTNENSNQLAIVHCSDLRNGAGSLNNAAEGGSQAGPATSMGSLLPAVCSSKSGLHGGCLGSSLEWNHPGLRGARSYGESTCYDPGLYGTELG